LYESLWNLLGFGILFFVSRKFEKKLLNGDITMLYFMHYSVGRFILEGMKIEVWTIGGIPTARWISILAFVLSLSVILYRHYRSRPVHG
jgi:phosphatidylglycerol:prolipoprotein diacylglycerol transferase